MKNNLSYSPKSHPTKLLVDHEKGVLSHCNVNDLLLLAVVFHDVGKMNDNFQKKIVGKPVDGYSNHAYISAYYLINAFVNNEDQIKSRFKFITEKNYDLTLTIIANIIVGHHGYLRNIDELFNAEEWNNMVEYLKTIKMTENVNTFFKQHHDLLNLDLEFVDDIKTNSDYYKSYGVFTDTKKWSENALKYYFTTIMSYGELVHGDRRDASGNLLNYREKDGKKYAYTLENNLEWIYRNFKSETELNIARNKIRKLAVKKLREYLKISSHRVFTLTSPTGSGKTFMMLQLAIEILKEFNHDYDIIYSLPYLSIIDQTTKILNQDLKIETLNYTSASDTSNVLQELMQDENSSKRLVEYAFSENCFDHPFIVTTFNQLFETMVSNSTSKLMKLKNYRKRIFLIDEFQAVSPAQYYFMMRMLQTFCEKYDCFAVVSTATMPNFGIDLQTTRNREVKQLFGDSKYPIELLPDDVFEYDVFNRYRINFMGEVNSKSLYRMVNRSTQSTLLIVNTVRTSRKMFNKFASRTRTSRKRFFKFKNRSGFDKLYLLNAHISPHDRLEIIKNVKQDLEQGIKILLVSTQVIEAGVDISFPTLYRDAAPPSSVVQANGRTNRSGEFGMVDSYLFLYRDEDRAIKAYDCNMVYYGTMTNTFRNDIKNKISPMTEINFHRVCERYFVGQSLYVTHGDVNNNQNLIYDILNGKFKDLGKYRFIQGDPDAHTIYVGSDVKLWSEYKKLFEEMQNACGYEERAVKDIEFKRIRGIILQNTINIRTKVFETIVVDQEDVFGVFRLDEAGRYSPTTGLREL